MLNSHDREAFGKRIQQRREELGLTQLDIAVSLGLTQAQISYFERGLRRIRIDELSKLANTLKVSVNWFYGPAPEFKNPTEALLALWYPLVQFKKSDIKKISEFLEDVLRLYVKHAKPKRVQP